MKITCPGQLKDVGPGDVIDPSVLLLLPKCGENTYREGTFNHVYLIMNGDGSTVESVVNPDFPVIGGQEPFPSGITRFYTDGEA
jgi:hypothetical protein